MFKWIFVFILLLTDIIEAQDIKNILGELSEYDKESLDELFHIMMEKDHLIYTLFGDKPVSLSGDYIITPYEVTLSGIPSGGVFWKKWAVWKRFQKNISISRYLFIEEPAYDFKHTQMRFIFFINKKAFIEIVNQNIQVFRDVLGDSISAHELLEKMQTEHAFMKILKGNEVLLGILLGYGESNAKLFTRRKKLKNFISARTLPIFPEKRPLPSTGFSSIEEEEEFLSRQLRPFSPCDRRPWIFLPVQFAADPNHKETQLIQQKYFVLRNKISGLYIENKNFLEFILLQLTSDSTTPLIESMAQ